LHFAKPETIVHHNNIDDCSAVFRKPSSSWIQPILELILCLASDDNAFDNNATAMELSDYDDEGIPVIIVIENQAIHVPTNFPTNYLITTSYHNLKHSSEMQYYL